MGASPQVIGMIGGGMIGIKMIGIGRRIGKIIGKMKALIKGKKKALIKGKKKALIKGKNQRCRRTPGGQVLLMQPHCPKRETTKADQLALGQ